MKNQRGIVLAPLLIIIGAVVVAGFAIYFLIQNNNVSKSENTNVVVNQSNNNTNSISNTNNAINTNQAVNTNTSSDINTAVDPTAGWKTYTNETHHYTIKYPADYQPGGTADNYFFQKGDITGPIRRLSILSLTSANHTNLEQSEFSGGYGWYDWAMDGFPNNTKGPAKYAINKHEDKIGANTFTVFNYDPGSSWGGAPFYFLVEDETVFLFTDQITGSSSSTLAKDIVNTFTLTNPTAGWKTYANSKLGFSIKTPANWEVDTTRSSSTEVVFLPNPGTESREAIKSTVTAQSLSDWIKTIDQQAIQSIVDTTVAGEPAKHVVTTAFALNYVGFRHGNRLFVVTSNTKILDLGILSTLQFTK